MTLFSKNTLHLLRYTYCNLYEFILFCIFKTVHFFCSREYQPSRLTAHTRFSQIDMAAATGDFEDAPVYRTNDVVPPPAWLPQPDMIAVMPASAEADGYWHCPVCRRHPFVNYRTDQKRKLDSHLNYCVNSMRKSYEADLARYDQGCDRLFME